MRLAESAGIKRCGLRYEWGIYHSGYGWTGGTAWTKWGARRKQNRAFAEWLLS